MTKDDQTIASGRETDSPTVTTNLTKGAEKQNIKKSSRQRPPASSKSGGKKSENGEFFVTTLDRHVESYRVLEGELKQFELGSTGSLWWPAGGGGCIAFGLDLLKDFFGDWDWSFKFPEPKLIVLLVLSVILIIVGLWIVLSRRSSIKKNKTLAEEIRRQSRK